MTIIVSVFNNLYTDQRVEKVCKTLYDQGYKILLIGNSWDGTPEMERPYTFFRIPLQSKSLKLAYPEFNKKLYNELLKRADKNTILLSNDLDTILPNFLVSKKLNIPMVFDSHEMFTEMPSLKGRWTQKIWRLLERTFVPKLKYMMTASESYAQWFQSTYKIEKPIVVQNFPRNLYLQQQPENNTPKIILYQGVINPSRGLDKVIPAMEKIENAELWIAGKGPKYDEYVSLTKKEKLTDKVKFLGKLLPDDLRTITKQADVGLSIEENNGLSYYYSLPNKVSDYIQAKVPVVVSAFPEMKKIVETYHVGSVIHNHSSDELAEKISNVLHNGKSHYRDALNHAATVLCWENEEPKILNLFNQVKEDYSNSNKSK